MRSVVIDAAGVVDGSFPEPLTRDQTSGEIALEQVANTLAGIAVCGKRFAATRTSTDETISESPIFTMPWGW
jgi:hypothetical protein